MKIEIVSRETIKPSSPTPHHLKTLKLSLLDQLSYIKYSPLIYFYPSINSESDQTVDISTTHFKKLQLLKTSLSTTLTKYYPFAGRRGDDQRCIDCNDQGVEFVEARVHHCVLHEILQRPDTKQLQELLPVDVESTAAATGYLLVIQANLFECGGIAIGICLTHKIADGFSYHTFVKNWASIARESDEVVNPDFFIGSSLFPAKESSSFHHIKFPVGQCVMRRFVFTPSKVEALRARAASSSVPKPTRAEAVTALLWKCSIAASRSVQGGSLKTSLSIGNRAVNLRRSFSSDLVDNAIGNFLAYVTTYINMENGEEPELQALVCQLRKVLQEFKTKEGENHLGYRDKTIQVTKKDVHFFSCSALLGMPVYEADFGWGKPIWVAFVRSMLPNTSFLRYTRDGDGVEALVWLTKEEMVVFEHNEELLEFATLSPGVCEEDRGNNINRNSRL